MIEIETLYKSYQELLLDLDIFGKIMSNQGLDDKLQYKDVLFEEYSRTHPLPSLENRDYELGDIVSEEYHVSYINNLELSEKEEVLSLDDDEDDEEESVTNYSTDYVEDDLKELPDGEFSKPISPEERDEKLSSVKFSFEIEKFTGNTDKVESVYGTQEVGTEGYIEEEQPDDSIDDEDSTSDEEDDLGYSDDDISSDEDSDEEFDYDDDELTENSEDTEDDDSYDDDNLEETSSEDDVSSDDSMFMSKDDIESYTSTQKQIPVNVPKPIIPNILSNTKKIEDEVEEDYPKDLLEYLRSHPRSEISEVLKHYPKKELEKYIRTGKLIKKGSKVYL